MARVDFDQLETLTANSVPFVGSNGALTQDNANFSFNDTTDTLTAKNITVPTNLTLSTFTQNSVPFAGASGLLSQDNANFAWNDTTDTLTAKNITVPTALTLSFLTQNSVLFAGASGAVSQDNANLAWNDTTDTLTAKNVTVPTGLTLSFLTANSIPYIGASGVVSQNNAALNWNNATSTLTATNITATTFTATTFTATTFTATNLIANTVSMTATSSLTGYAPTANTSPTTTGAFKLQTTTTSTDIREYLMHVGLTSNQGSTHTGFNKHKVALYAAVDALSGTGDVWSFNTVVTQNASSGTYDAQGYELDLNNNNAHRGDTDAAGGLAAPVSYGLTVTGNGSFRSTAAILISGPGTGIWNRGIVIGNASVTNAVGARGSSFQDLGTAHKSIDIRGSVTYGIYQSQTTAVNYMAGNSAFGLSTIDTNPALATEAITLAGGKFLGGINAAGTVVKKCIGVTSSDRVQISGDALDIQWGVALVALGGGAAPTLGTIGGSGPVTAAQNSWMRVVDSAGAAFWVPAWK
jgi:hypothetical protein